MTVRRLGRTQMASHVDIRLPDNGSRHLVRELAPRLVAQLRAQYYLGELRRGDRLPAIRQLARDLGVTATTALEIYKNLEDNGLVASRERSGVFFESVGHERNRLPSETALAQLLLGMTRKLKLQRVDVSRFTQLLRWHTGAEIRPDYAFACCTCHESYEVMTGELRREIGFNLPIRHISLDRAANARQALAGDRTIRCILTTFLASARAFELARSFNLQVILIRLEPTVHKFLADPNDGRRYLVTRDRDCAESLRRIACSLFSEGKDGDCVTALNEEECARCERRTGRAPKHLCIASLEEVERLHEIDRDAKVVHAPFTALTQVQARYHATKTVSPLVFRLSRDTVDDMLFEYVFRG
jgi:DNA-binding transcriptional regulator YhcF (GntR family)